jgi:hypothetical protein
MDPGGMDEAELLLTLYENPANKQNNRLKVDSIPLEAR